MTVLFLGGIYIALPLIMIWGWARWSKQKHPRNAFAHLSFLGFTLATASLTIAVASISYALAIRSFPFHDPILLNIYRSGSVLSIAGLTFAIIGTWQPSALRWHAPTCAAGTLLFWLASAAGE